RRKVAPLPDRAEAFMQEDERRHARLRLAEPFICDRATRRARERHAANLARDNLLASMRPATWLVLIATLLLWSGNWIVARAVREEISPGLATFGRLIIVLLALAPFVWRELVSKLPQLGRRDWLILAALGLAGGGPHLAMQWLGGHYTTAASGHLHLTTTPTFILLITT